MDAVWCSKWIWEVFEVELDNLCNLKGISWRLIFWESTVIWIISVRGPRTLAAPLWTLCAETHTCTITHAGVWLRETRAIFCGWYSPGLWRVGGTTGRKMRVNIRGTGLVLESLHRSNIRVLFGHFFVFVHIWLHAYSQRRGWGGGGGGGGGGEEEGKRQRQSGIIVSDRAAPWWAMPCIVCHLTNLNQSIISLSRSTNQSARRYAPTRALL